MRPLTPSAREALGRQAASICAPATRECAYRDALKTLELMDSVMPDHDGVAEARRAAAIHWANKEAAAA